MVVTIKSDRKWRNLLYGYELPKKQRKEFDYIKSDEEFETRNFAKYHGQYYDINEFQVLPIIGDASGKHVVYPEFRGWDGYMNDTYSSGVLIKLSSDGEQYKIGRFYS
jgi:hypothetical protein